MIKLQTYLLCVSVTCVCVSMCVFWVCACLQFCDILSHVEISITTTTINTQNHSMPAKGLPHLCVKHEQPETQQS